ncbi:hypothetical protein DAMA08_000350 [Martiniozyma asiatica (nom. inval.)]|nr:hypothetical protein DAMA08_000350 [Martiniozyma asiatica]
MNFNLFGLGQPNNFTTTKHSTSSDSAMALDSPFSDDILSSGLLLSSNTGYSEFGGSIYDLEAKKYVFYSKKFSWSFYVKHTCKRIYQTFKRFGRVRLFTLLAIYYFIFMNVWKPFSRQMYFHSKSWIYLNEHDLLGQEKISQILDLSPLQLNSLNLEFSKISDQPPTSQEFDQRAVVALYLYEIKEEIKSNDGVLDPLFKIQFNWDDWVNIDSRLMPSNDYLMLNNGKGVVSCAQYSREIGFPERSWINKDKLKNCTELTSEEILELKNVHYPHLKIDHALDDFPLSIQARIVHGASYLYHNFPNPQRLVFVDGNDNIELTIPVIEKGLVTKEKNYKKNYIEKVRLHEISLSNQWKTLKNEIQNFNKDSLDEYISTDISRAQSLIKRGNSIELSPEDFTSIDFDELRTKYEQMKQTNSKSLEFEWYKNVNKVLKFYPDGLYPKYFHEPAINHQIIDGAHFDWRFFNIPDKITNYYTNSHLHRMARVWLRFAKSIQIDTWIAHGTLLGDYFNGMVLPWDTDHDVQISFKSMWKLAIFYNKSLIIDVTRSSQSGELSDAGFGQYYLDISDFIFDRRKGNGNNAIDARFIDIHTGMYIDITVVSEVENKNKGKEFSLNQFTSTTKTEFFGFLKQNRLTQYDLNNEFILGCKNNHYYAINEISPLKVATFEGVVALVPHKFKNILTREFPFFKSRWSYEDYTWRKKFSSFISNEICSNSDREGTTCVGKMGVNLIEEWQDYILMHTNRLRDIMYSSKSKLNDDETVAAPFAVGNKMKSEQTLEEYPRILKPDWDLMRLANYREFDPY